MALNQLITLRTLNQQAEPGLLVGGLSSPTRSFAIGITIPLPEDDFLQLGPIIVEELYGEGVNVAIVYLALARVISDKKL